MFNFKRILGVICAVLMSAAYNAETTPKENADSSTELPEPGACGIQSTEERIYGGNVTAIDEFPWMALLEYEHAGKVILGCGGSLINTRFVLTAAHCVDKRMTKVRLGEYDTRNETDCVMYFDSMECTKSIRVDVIAATAHPNFRLSHGLNDIALIKMKDSVKYTDFIKPICLATKQLKLPNSFTVAGWGETETEEESPLKLKVQVPLFDKEKCTQLYKSLSSPRRLGVGQICAGGEKGKDSCVGDSGGPLMAGISAKDEIWYQFGVVSFGPSPCGEMTPAVYAVVSDYMPWILEYIKK